MMIAEQLVYLMNKNEENQQKFKEIPNIIPKKKQTVQLRTIGDSRTPMDARTKALSRKIALS